MRIAPIPSHPELFAGADGHIYDHLGSRVAAYLKEAGEKRFRVYCRLHGYHSVARLVAEAFFGPIAPGLSVVHRDGDPSNNMPTNLELVREAGQASNYRSRTKMTPEAIRELHVRLSLGIRHTHIARDLGITPRCVRYHKNSCRCQFGGNVQMPFKFEF